MDELKLLIDMVGHLPAMALWVLVGFFVYKVVVIGSIYGVIRFVAGGFFEWMKTRHNPPKEIRATIDGLCITSDGSHDELVIQLKRMKGISIPSGSSYIHRADVEWLASVIDAKLAENRKAP